MTIPNHIPCANCPRLIGGDDAPAIEIALGNTYLLICANCAESLTSDLMVQTGTTIACKPNPNNLDQEAARGLLCSEQMQACIRSLMLTAKWTTIFCPPPSLDHERANLLQEDIARLVASYV